MSLHPNKPRSGPCPIVQILLILIGLNSVSLSALDLKPSPKDYRSLQVEIMDPPPGLELRLSYGASYSSDETKLHVKELGDQRARMDVALSEKDITTLHDMLRAIVQGFRLEDTPTIEEKLDMGTIPFRLRISTAESSMEFAYLPHDRPRSDPAAACYFWLLQKLPAEWQKRVTWRDQFDLWKPKNSASTETPMLDTPATLRCTFAPEHREAEELSASFGDVHRLIAWQLDISPPFKSAVELVALAKSRITEYGLADNYEIKHCAGIDWRRHDAGNGWYVSVHFFTALIKDPNATVPPKDDGHLIEVPMLPDGTRVKVKTRAMTNAEMEEHGLRLRTSPSSPEPNDPFTSKQANPAAAK